MKRRGKRKQLELVIPTWGGKRRGAGRKRVAARESVAHVRRVVRAGRFPVLVTSRVREEWRGLRSAELREALLGVVAATNAAGVVRICEFCFIDDHVHLLIEAADGEALSRGVTGFNARLAAVLHAHHGRRGRVIESRYHARDLTTPREVRNALGYTINNARRHGYTFERGAVDPFSSGAWSVALVGAIDLSQELGPTVSPRTWLLQHGWRRNAPPVHVDEVPGSMVTW